MSIGDKMSMIQERNINLEIKELEEELKKDIEYIGAPHIPTMQKLRRLRRERQCHNSK